MNPRQARNRDCLKLVTTSKDKLVWKKDARARLKKPRFVQQNVSWIRLYTQLKGSIPNLNQIENQSETCGLLKLEAVEVKTEAIFGLSSLEYPKVPNLEAVYYTVYRCNFQFQDHKAAASMTSKVNMEARFGFSGPSYLLDPVFEAEIGLINHNPTLQKASV